MKLFDIIKSRWPEAVMVAGLQACFLFLFQNIKDIQEQSLAPSGRLLLVSIGTGILGIFSQILLWGFVHSAVVDGVQAMQPMDLLRAGRTYIWKLILFHCVSLILAALITLMVLIPAILIISKGIIPREIPVWLEFTSVIITNLALVKWAYFIPAILIVQDCRFLESMVFMKEIDIFKLRSFLILVLVVFSIVFGLMYVASFVNPKDILYYPVTAITFLFSGTGTLLLFMAAVFEVNHLRQKSIEDHESREGKIDDN